MEPIKKILFVTDLSDNARRAFEYASGVADRYGATIVVLHVLEGTSPANEDYVAKLIGSKRLASLKEDAKQEAKDIIIGKSRSGVILEEALDKLCNDVQKDSEQGGVPTDTMVITDGKVVDGIIDTCKKACCDLIVMSHPVRRVIDEPVFGRTTRGVLRRSTKPVLLIPPLQQK